MLSQACALLSAGAALQLLDQVLAALGVQARNDWDVLLWVLHVTPLDLHRHLRSRWKAQQAALLTPWLVRASSHHFPSHGCLG